MNAPSEFGVWLRQLRAARDLTQEALAEDVGCASQTLLATSRERLNLHAEWMMELGGLGLPPDDQPQSIARADAVLLFVTRARRITRSPRPPLPQRGQRGAR